MSLSLPPSDATRGEVELTLTGASFGYRPEKVLLHDLTLSARAGDLIGSLGATLGRAPSALCFERRWHWLRGANK